MNISLSDIIRNVVVVNNTNTTTIPFVTNTPNRSKFDVSVAKIPDLFKGWCDLINKIYNDDSDEDENTLSLFEIVSTNKLPLTINMNLKFHLDEDIRERPNLYEEEFFLAVTHSIQKLQKELLELQPNMSDLFCLVLETESWVDNEITYICIKFQFPYCNLDRSYYNEIFRPKLIQNFRKNKILDYLVHHPIGDWETILDEPKDIVPMYGSRGINKEPHFTFVHLYPDIKEDDIKDDESKEIELVDYFNPKNHSWIHTGLIKPNFLNIEKDVDYWLPLILSINFWPGITHPKENDSENSRNSINFDNDVTSKDSKIMSNYLLKIISEERLKTEPFWIDIGKILYNIYNGNKEGLKLWITYSSKTKMEERNESNCEKRWSQFSSPNLTVKTLAWYARLDKPDQYKEWHEAWCKNALLESTSKTNADVAEALYRVFWLDYICARCDKGGWYKFTGTHLRPLDDAVDLRREISSTFIPMYKKIRFRAADKARDPQLSDGDKKNYENQIVMLTKLISALGSQAFESSVIKSSQKLFYVDDFNKVRDKDPNLTAWLNCVIETCGMNAYIRPGKPEDFITKNTNRFVRQDLHWQHPLVLELLEWFGQMFPEKEFLHWWLKDLSSFLYGRNAEKYLRIWGGESGDNGKSMVVKLMQMTLGRKSVV